VWHNVHSQQHTHVSSSYRSSRLGLSHLDPYAMHRGSCLELYYCNMVEWCWWDSSLIWKTNWFPSLLWHCWFGHMTCKNRPRNDLYCVWWDVKPCSINQSSVEYQRAVDALLHHAADLVVDWIQFVTVRWAQELRCRVGHSVTLTRVWGAAVQPFVLLVLQVV